MYESSWDASRVPGVDAPSHPRTLGAQDSVSGGAARIAHRMARGPCVGLCAAGRRVIGSVFRFEGTDVERYIDCWITGILGAVTVRMSCMAQYTTSHRKTFPNHA